MIVLVNEIVGGVWFEHFVQKIRKNIENNWNEAQ